MKAQSQAQRRSEPATIEDWNQIRQNRPWLKLHEFFGDRLSQVLAGWDASLSAASYDSFWAAIKKSPDKAADVLLRFCEANRSTFYASGWIDVAVARIVVGDLGSDEEERAAKKFVTQLWKELKHRAGEKTLRAFAALQLGEGEHNKHWLALAERVRALPRDKRNQPSLFAQKAVAALPQPSRPQCHASDCMSDVVVAVMAELLAECGDVQDNTELVDRARAFFAGVSLDTVRRTRAEINSFAAKRRSL